MTKIVEYTAPRMSPGSRRDGDGVKLHSEHSQMEDQILASVSVFHSGLKMVF